MPTSGVGPASASEEWDTASSPVPRCSGMAAGIHRVLDPGADGLGQAFPQRDSGVAVVLGLANSVSVLTALGRTQTDLSAAAWWSPIHDAPETFKHVTARPRDVPVQYLPITEHDTDGADEHHAARFPTNAHVQRLVCQSTMRRPW
jgi:hypothetical protein